MTAAKKSGMVTGTLTELDTNYDGLIEASVNMTNNELADARVANQYATARGRENSPWGGVLWGKTPGGAPKMITLEQHGAGGNISAIMISAKNSSGRLLYTKFLSVD